MILLNISIFAAIYYQRERREKYTRRIEELIESDMVSSTSSIEKPKTSRKSSIESKYAKAEEEEKKFFLDNHIFPTQSTEENINEHLDINHAGCSVPRCFHSNPSKKLVNVPVYLQDSNISSVFEQNTAFPVVEHTISPSIPDPPPPPKGNTLHYASILRNNNFNGAPSTPNCSKKRVQIQEISV